MRHLMLLFALIACDKSKPAAPAVPAAQLIETMHGLADRACACGDDRQCLRAVRDDFDARKATLAPSPSHSPADAASLAAERLRLRMCGDAGGLTMWN